MSFTVTVMQNDEPYNKINKSITSGTDYTGSLVDESSIVDPVIMVESATMPAGNYAYISEFGRYYFIKNIESYRTNLWRITMHCDVLRSFASGILSSPAIVARSSNNFNMLMNDDHYYTQENPYIFTKAFPSGFDTSQASYVLALVGQASAGEGE